MLSGSEATSRAKDIVSYLHWYAPNVIRSVVK